MGGERQHRREVVDLAEEAAEPNFDGFRCIVFRVGDLQAEQSGLHAIALGIDG